MILLSALTFLAFSGGPSGQIAYISGTEQEDLCVTVADVGSGSQTRAGLGQRDGAPVWSPDGTQLAFEYTGDDLAGICVVQPDGSQRRLLKHAQEWNHRPAWSPDSRRLAYSSNDGSPETETIRVFDLESDTEQAWGGGRPGLTRPRWLGESLLVAVLQARLEEVGGDEAALWKGITPDPMNTILAIGMTGKPGNLSTDIFVVMSGHALPLPSYVMPSKGDYAEWAVEPNPNGKQIAFESNDGGDREIFVLSHKGALDISNHRAADWNPVWSPRGDWLAFESFRGGRRGVYRVNPGTALVSAVAADAKADNWAPAWSPDGQWMVFVSNATGNAELFISDASGRQSRQLTHTSGLNYAPAWRPEPRK